MQARSKENLIFLTEGYVPPLSELYKVYPQRPRYKRTATKGSKDFEKAVACIVNAYAQQLTCQTFRLTTPPPLETWVLGPATKSNSELAGWFKEERLPTSYRVFIHKQPQRHEGHELFYGQFGKPHTLLKIRHRKGTFAHLKKTSEGLLEEIVKAYQEDHKAVRDRIANTNHPFAFSGGLLEG